MIYVLLDDEGEPVRYFDHEATGTIKLPDPPAYAVDWDNFDEALL